MDLVALIESGSTSLVYLVAAGLVLGGLHGLEPGHSKTMMAAFIIAVRGTVTQAVLLGVSAAFSHSIIVWVLAVAALEFGDEMIAESAEPYFLMVSGAIILVIGVVMLYRLLQSRRRAQHHGHDNHHGHAHHHGHEHAHDHGHAHDHDHYHADSHHHGHAHDHGHHPAHSHGHEHHPHAHHAHDHSLDGDAHAQAHAREIETRFADGRATTLQTIGFGLTGGLIPCPAAITVLILCLHIGEFGLGIAMVAAFSTGLALTLVLVGVVAAVGLRAARDRYGAVDRFYQWAPYLSGVLIILIGIYMASSGVAHL